MTYTGESGLYSAILPDKKTKKIIYICCDYFDLPPVEDPHVTVMYSLEPVVGKAEFPDEKLPITLTVSGIEFLGEFNNFLTLTFEESDKLMEIHNGFVEKGAKHTWGETLTPHVTIGAKLSEEKIKEVSKNIETIEAVIKGTKMTFTSGYVTDLED